MRERDVEQALKHAVEKAGGMCLKFTSPGMIGVPDRLIIMPGGKIMFVEVKAPGQQPRPIQQRRQQQLTNLGAEVHTIDHPTQIPQLLQHQA